MTTTTVDASADPKVAAVTAAGIVRKLSAIAATGMLVGLLVGGIGGRLAMRLLFLTSTAVRGIRSDDGFVIGRFSVVDTANVLFTGAAVGVIGAFVYLAVRPLLIGPQWFRRATCAVGGGVVIGAVIVHPDGVDFTLLEPLPLAVGLFVFLPALFALVVGPVADRALAPDSWFLRARPAAALAPLLAYALPPLTPLAAIGAAVMAVQPRVGAWFARVRGVRTALVLFARCLALAIFAWGALNLVADVRALT